MPVFTFTSPEGKSYDITGPEGSTKEQAFDILNKQLGEKKSAPASAPVPKAEPKSAPPSKPTLPSMFTTAPQPLAEAAGSLAALRGLSSDILGMPGGLESMITPPAKGELKGHETIFPTPEEIRQGYSKIGIPEPTAEPLKAAQVGGEYAPLTFAGTDLLRRGLGLGADYIGGLVGKAFGGESTKAATALREKLAGERGVLQENLNKIKAQQVTPERQGEVDRLNAEIAKRDKALDQLKSQSKVAERKAETQMPPPTGVAAMKPVREEVQSQMGARAATAKQNVEAATAKVGEAAEREKQARQAVDELDKQLMAKPGMGKDQFGAIVRNIANDIKARFGAAREKAADYAGVFERAGKKPTINTSPLSTKIEAEIASTGDPAKRTFLQTLKAELETPELPFDKNKINLQKAHSVKGFLDRMVAGNQEKDFLVNQDIATKARQYKIELLKEMVKQHPDYGKAMSEYRKASRPLDIVEQRTGTTVSNILDENSLSKESKLADAEVAGAVINKANAGHSVFSRLLQESPELKDAARLHFTQDLFGREIAPTDAGFANWLRTNENSLRQLNLFEEFKDLRTAKKSAKEAVDFANDVVSQAKHDKQMAEMVSKAESKRLSEASKRTEQATKEAQTPEQLLAEKEARATKAKERLTGEKEKAQKNIENINESESRRMTAEQSKKDESIRQLSNAISDIQRGTKPSETAKNVTSIVKNMENQGLITEAQRNEMLDAAKGLAGSIEQQKASAKRLSAVVALLALPVAGPMIQSKVRTVTGY